MKRERVLILLLATLAVLAVLAVPALAQDVHVSSGSPQSPFAQNKQNEPTIAAHPFLPNVLVAGANDEIDLEPHTNGNAPFTPGVGLTGFYYSVDGGSSWTQPTYMGWSARTGTPMFGPIGTVPWYFEAGLASNGDPAMAFGPAPDSAGAFAWGNGVRLYYANLAANFSAVRSEHAFRGAMALGVSRFDGPYTAAGFSDQDNWHAPVIASRRLSTTTFSDKEMIWADNAESSPFFGNVYLGWVSFRSLGSGPEPVVVARSTDGGTTWSSPRQLTSATNTNQTGGRQGVTIRTDSEGTIYVFWIGTDIRTRNTVQYMSRSFDGGVSFERPRPVATVVEVGALDPVQGRFTFDGVAGARTNSFPSVDIANGAPSGAGATDRIVMAWADARNGLNSEQALVQVSSDGGNTWSMPVNAAEVGDRPDFPWVAISPDGQDVYITYMGFLDPWRSEVTSTRRMMGVVRHAEFAGLAGWTTLHRGAVGDARGSSANSLSSEFLGDYNWVVATNDFASAVWNDVRNAAVDNGVLGYRAALLAGSPIAKPATLAPTFGNTDIFGITLTDPTP